jgi:hypothetical protein
MTSTAHNTVLDLNGLNNVNQLIERLTLVFAKLAVTAENAGEQIAWDRIEFENNFDVEFHGWKPEDRIERHTVNIKAIGINNGN